MALSVFSFCLFAFVPTLLAAPPNDACDLPQSLQREITTKYPNAKLVTLLDLREDDKRFFQKSHGDACPGLVKVDYYGDRQPTWALSLISGDGAKEKAELVVAHQVGNDWRIASLETAKLSVPVVWSQGPGHYRDVYGQKQIRATSPIIVFGEYGGWIILYSWTGKTTDKIWLID
ncbi:MAG: hypothetical protein LAO19_15520 [Acidobacteriia bacterium]|nr:hypothetical protein [Terriglobia bacterium]